MDEVGGRERRNFMTYLIIYGPMNKRNFAFVFSRSPPAKKQKKNVNLKTKKDELQKMNENVSNKIVNFFSLLFNTMIMSVYSLGLHKLKV